MALPTMFGGGAGGLPAAEQCGAGCSAMVGGPGVAGGGAGRQRHGVLGGA